MATKTVSEQTGPATGRAVPRNSLFTYKLAADEEVRAYSNRFSEYERSLEQVTRKASRPSRLPFMRAGESRSSDSRTVNNLLMEWENDRTMSAILGNGDRAVRRFQAQPEAARTPHPADATGHYELEPGVVEQIFAHLAQVRQIPIMIAAVCTLVAVISAWFIPATVVTGLMASQTLVLPHISDSDQALFDYSTPMSEDMLSTDVSKVDTKKFDMLTLRDYVVQPGETLSHIANRFNLHIDTIISFNNITNPRAISAGTQYKIPNRDGLRYKVLAKDTLDSIAKKFGVTVTVLLDGNNLSDVKLLPGSLLFIPDARMNSMDLKLILGELFSWPIYGYISSTYGYRVDPFTGIRMFHNGIDIAGNIGDPIRAGMEGRVVDVESQVGNYGKMIIIQHPRGFKTLYGHLSAFRVEVGQYVSQGQIIGLRGNSGRSTGPHTHFSVIRNGEFVNPLRYLK